MTRALLLIGVLAWAPLLIAPPSSAHAQSPAETATAAHDAFWQEDYREASRLYGRLVEAFGLDSAAVLFNLGTAQAKAGKLGQAVHSFRRAQALGPSGQLAEDLAANLAFVRESLGERYRKEIPEAQFAFIEAEPLLWRIFHVVPPPLAIWGFVAVWTAFFLLASLVRLGKVKFNPPVRSALWALGLAAATGGAYAAGQSFTANSTKLGVVVAPRAQIKEGRHPSAPARRLPEGLEVRLLEEAQDGWTRVELSNGQTGWLEPNTLLRL